MTQPASLSFDLANTNATTRLADALAAKARPGLCVLLEGPVGAGKTFLARAVLHALMRAQGPIEDVPSPTFTLVQTYEVGALDVWHADLYRLTAPEELVELGLDAAFDQAFCLVEWPDRLGVFQPSGAARIALEPDPHAADMRTARITGPADLTAHLSTSCADLIT